MTTSLSWLTQIPASTTQEYAAGPEGAETLHLVFALITGTGDHYRRTPTGDAVAELVEEVARLRADLEEARLTLAAEQGKPEGAPSPGWEPCRVDDDGGWGWRKKTADGFLFAQGTGVEPVESERGLRRRPGGWERWLADSEGFLVERVACVFDDTWTARTAMLAADRDAEAR